MRGATRNLIRIAVALIGWAGALLACSYIEYRPELARPGATLGAIILSGMLTFVVPIVISIGLLFAIPLSRPSIPHLWHRAWLLPALLVLTVAYVATWHFGAPLVRQSLRSEALGRYETVAPEPSHGPWIHTYLAVPVLPCILLSYHEYQVAPLYGEGAWYFHLWWGSKVLQVGKVGTWIS
jgi:hypothetical protein